MEVKKVLFDLASQIGVAGDEFAASQCACDYLRVYASDAKVDKFGNVIAKIGNDESKPTVLLDAHIDQIGLIVTYIDDNGFLKVGNVGGVDRRLLLAQEVTVHSKTPLYGVICSKPPHLEKPEESKKAPEIDAIAIDVGLSKDDASEIICLGDRVTLNSKPTELLNNRVSSSALDDRSGVTSILYALELMKGNYPCNIVVQFTAQEELGGRGAKIASYHSTCDYALAVDVSFALTPDAQAHKCGKMGDGVMIGASPSLDKALTKTLIDIAKAKGIPYQVEVMPGLTSTNADDIAQSGAGTRAGTLSIPLRYMHTPIEVLQISDIEATSRLIAEFINHVGQEGA